MRNRKQIKRSTTPQFCKAVQVREMASTKNWLNFWIYSDRGRKVKSYRLARPLTKSRNSILASKECNRRLTHLTARLKRVNLFKVAPEVTSILRAWMLTKFLQNHKNYWDPVILNKTFCRSLQSRSGLRSLVPNWPGNNRFLTMWKRIF